MSQKWLMYHSSEVRFPYHIFIEEKPGEYLHLKTQDKWPGPGKNLFCKSMGIKSENELPKETPLEVNNIISLRRYGKKMTVILDRKIRKRCWFIFLKKKYKKKEGEYEQIFWITQSSIIKRRPGAYLPKRRKDDFEVIIDVSEKYPYSFGKARIKREKLAVGDYALFHNGKIVAIAERKTLDEFIHEISRMDVFKAKLQEMEIFLHKAVVFESAYEDFINPKRIKYYSASYIAELLADLIVQFSHVQFIFCNNRRSANEWVYRWFARIKSNLEK
jgi:hypothetical protein